MEESVKNLYKASPVLVASSNDEENKEIVKWLRSENYTADSVSLDDDIITQANKKKYSVIITDSNSGKEDPLKLPFLINSQKKISKSSFILILRKENENLIKSIKENGYDDFIYPPLKKDELISRVETLKKINKLENTLARAVKYIQSGEKSSTDLKNISDDIIIQWGKLETLGRLISGIIHEITTPVQYVSDNINFLEESISSLILSLKTASIVIEDAKDKPIDKTRFLETDNQIKESDFEYLSEEIPQAISQTISGIDKIAEILLSVRNLSRQNSVDLVHENINKIIDHSIIITKNLWKNIANVNKDLDPAIPKILCQPGQISQVTVNLIINAIHAIEENLGKNKKIINISTRFKNNFIYIEVTDTGKGIESKNLKKIFNPFYTTKKIDKGTGQGLAISKTIIENHKGSISVKSAPGKGSVFTIKIPAIKNDKIEKEPKKKKNNLISKNRPVKKPFIIFVDNNEDVLLSMQRMLRSKNKTWDLSFVKSDKEAINLLEKKPADIIVTDYDVNDQSGFELLKVVKERYPQTERIIISSETNEKEIMKTVTIANQFLSKPVKPAKLKETLTRTCAMKNILKDKNLKQTLSKISSLPPIPSIYNEIIEELNSSSSSTKRIGEIISKDAAMTSKILQIINSGFFYLSTKISRPSEAVVLLGMDTVKALILHIHIFSKLKLTNSIKNFQTFLQTHTMQTASIAKQIALMEEWPQLKSEQAFMAGLLHDCGKLVLASNFPDKYEKVIKAVETNKTSFFEEEKKEFGVSHDIVGAFLMGIWGLPLSLIEGILYHHNPDDITEDKLGISAVVYIANILSIEKIENKEEMDEDLYDKALIERLNIKDKLISWRESVFKN